jgi:hypothetical protein
MNGTITSTIVNFGASSNVGTIQDQFKYCLGRALFSILKELVFGIFPFYFEKKHTDSFVIILNSSVDQKNVSRALQNSYFSLFL